MRLIRHTLSILLLAAALAGLARPASALEAIEVPRGGATLDLTDAVEHYSSDTDRLQVSTAPGADGIVRRIEVRSQLGPGPSDWLVFALANTSDEQIDRLLVAPHYRLVGSGVLSPDLGSVRLIAVTPSEGFAPDQLKEPGSDVFRITLDPGAVVTYIAETSSPRMTELHLWEPQAYEANVNSFTLFRGIVLGIAGLLALFLTVLFVVRGTAMFPASAILAWAVFGYIALDFGVIGQVFGIGPESLQAWRAAVEVLLSLALTVFLFTYLHLHRWHIRYAHLTGIWLIVLIALLGIILIDPTTAAGIARLSLAATVLLGLGVIAYLALRGFDRAIMLVPSWAILLFWLVMAWLAVSGRVDNPSIQPALAGGLVLLVMLIAFTIMQHAFAGGGLAHGIVSDAEQKALALVGAGHAIWDWDVARDRIEIGREIENVLGLKRGALEGPARNWLGTLHPADRDRFRAVLDAVIAQRRGRINQTFRMRAADGRFLWFQLKARPIVGADGEVMRCSGTLADITEARLAEDRLLHDAIFDNLTGLPNRQLFLDRVEQALLLAEASSGPYPAIVSLDLDDFHKVNQKSGTFIGDSVLLAISRRLSRLIAPADTLARLGGDGFAVLTHAAADAEALNELADALREAVRAAIPIGDEDIRLSASAGISRASAGAVPGDILKDAETASFEAKRQGGDRTVTHRAGQTQRRRREDLETDLAAALDGGEIDLVYQPIIRLSDSSVAGYEALMRWDHPRRGAISPTEFIPLAEETGLILQLGVFTLERAARDLAVWQAEIRNGPLPFVSVNVSSQQLLRHDLINDVKSVLTRSGVAPETLKLEVTESLFMQNPDFAARVLEEIRRLGASLALDDFGTGHSALSYLQRFPFDTIKVDRAFVASNGSANRPVILRSIVNLAHELGMDVIAEGAESETDVGELVQLGCEFVQGYLYGRPISSQMAHQMAKASRPLARSA
ncbi:EAL domain-containing protein [Afifella sp. IM 167]|uniref:EAL domain-containing protein n=1 Tax=Afifella sp. IM 167 TaxID=2033586 RepID=UPI001CCA2640|nr:EAL domain-containing protein [Afifella sp. IM 167]MBZ8133445.1 sensor domain-containing phosphodiesterase [Afifella sp. IM 167]